MSNLATLIAAGVVPQNHTLSYEDQQTVEGLSQDEVNCLIDLKSKLGDDFIRRNTADGPPNCIL